MNITIQMRVDSNDGDPSVVDIATIEREALSSASFGLSIAEGKAVLRQIQQTLTEHQVENHIRQLRWCPHCGNTRVRNGSHTLVIRTAFGKLRFNSPRFKHCRCVKASTKTFSPLAEVFAERTTPELAYLQAKWASLMSYGMTVSLLNDTLPIEGEVCTSSVRRQLHRVAERSESELGDEHYSYIDGCPRDWESLPRPNPQLPVGLDGGYVRGREGASRSEGHFEVIVGKSMAESDSKCIAFVNRYDKKPKCRVFRMLKEQGMQFNQQVTFLSDGGDTVRNLQLYLNPQAEHVLDWFHVTMRITVMRNMVKRLSSTENPAVSQSTDDLLERVKWYLWHGNVYRALQNVEELSDEVHCADNSKGQRKLLTAVNEFERYISVNRPFIPDYGDRYRNGESIATGFVESAVNQVISKRCVKSQSMRWTERGAHLLLQVRTMALDDELRSTFERWHPDMKLAA